MEVVGSIVLILCLSLQVYSALLSTLLCVQGV